MRREGEGGRNGRGEGKIEEERKAEGRKGEGRRAEAGTIKEGWQGMGKHGRQGTKG